MFTCGIIFLQTHTTNTHDCSSVCFKAAGWEIVHSGPCTSAGKCPFLLRDQVSFYCCLFWCCQQMWLMCFLLAVFYSFPGRAFLWPPHTLSITPTPQPELRLKNCSELISLFRSLEWGCAWMSPVILWSTDVLLFWKREPLFWIHKIISCQIKPFPSSQHPIKTSQWFPMIGNA